jgi:4-amino-4-deoxy-L-arabinose transferase-like glycosyltransferase
MTSENTGLLEPRPLVVLALLVLATLVPRALVFPINENLHGDAVVRTELAERWAQDPHWISGFHDGAYQFGPLHVYAVGAGLWILPERADAGRWVSLFFGVLSVIPLYLLTRRMFGWRAGLVAGLAFAAWGMQVQFSTTAVSEAMSLFLILGTLAAFARGCDDGRLRPLFVAAVLLNLACATRYDAWLLVPLLCVLLVFQGGDRVAGLTRGVLFGLFCLPFPMVWMQGNELATGSPLYPLQYISSFHATWAAEGVASWGQAGFRLHNLLFWPAMALLTLSPLVAALGLVGMVKVFREQPRHRWLIWVAAVPTAYFTFRSVVLMDFVPLGRFTAGQLVLLLPFVSAGFAALTVRMSAPLRQGLAGATALLAVATPLWLGLFTWQAEPGVAVALNPVSPVAQNPRPLMEAALRIREVVGPSQGALLVDVDPMFADIQLAFFSELPESRLVRARWGDLEARLEHAQPEWLVRIEGGELERRPDFAQRDGRVLLGEHWFEEVDGSEAPYQLYRRARSDLAPQGPGTAGAPASPVAPREPRAN